MYCDRNSTRHERDRVPASLWVSRSHFSINRSNAKRPSLRWAYSVARVP
jgi:hypothetical protein